MSADDRKNKITDDAVKNEAVELNDDDLDAVAGGNHHRCKSVKGYTETSSGIISQEGAVFHKCDYAKSDDIAFIKGENVIKKG